MPGTVEEAAKKLNDAVADTKKTMEGVQQRLGTVEEAVKGSSEAIEEVTQLRKDVDATKQSITELSDSIKALSAPGGKEDRLKHDPAYHSPLCRRHFQCKNAAIDFANQVKAGLLRMPESMAHCEKYGIPVLWERDDGTKIDLLQREMQIGGDAEGGMLVTEEAAMVIWDLMEEFGKAANEAYRIPMTTAEKKLCLPNGGIDVYFLDELEEMPKVDELFRMTLIKAQRVGAYTAWSEEFDQDVTAWQGEQLARLFAYAYAKKRDKCVLIADGTSDYGSMVGLFNDSEITTVSMGSGDTAFTNLAYEDVLNLIFAVDAETLEEEDRCAFWCNRNVQTILASIVFPGTDIRILTGAGTKNPMCLGYPVKTQGFLPGVAASGAGKNFLGFGSIYHSWAIGDRMALRVKISRELMWLKDATAIGVMARMGGQRYATGHFAKLKTADS